VRCSRHTLAVHSQLPLAERSDRRRQFGMRSRPTHAALLVGGAGRCLGIRNLLLRVPRCRRSSPFRLRHWTQPGGRRCSNSDERDREHDNDRPARRSTRRLRRGRLPRHLRDWSGLKSWWWRCIRDGGCYRRLPVSVLCFEAFENTGSAASVADSEPVTVRWRGL
jgi:hypothetical protein